MVLVENKHVDEKKFKILSLSAFTLHFAFVFVRKKISYIQV